MKKLQELLFTVKGKGCESATVKLRMITGNFVHNQRFSDTLFLAPLFLDNYSQNSDNLYTSSYSIALSKATSGI